MESSPWRWWCQPHSVRVFWFQLFPTSCGRWVFSFPKKIKVLRQQLLRLLTMKVPENLQNSPKSMSFAYFSTRVPVVRGKPVFLNMWFDASMNNRIAFHLTTERQTFLSSPAHRTAMWLNERLSREFTDLKHAETLEWFLLDSRVNVRLHSGFGMFLAQLVHLHFTRFPRNTSCSSWAPSITFKTTSQRIDPCKRRMFIFTTPSFGD